jgi:hypothetical protein
MDCEPDVGRLVVSRGGPSGPVGVVKEKTCDRWRARGPDPWPGGHTLTFPFIRLWANGWWLVVTDQWPVGHHQRRLQADNISLKEKERTSDARAKPGCGHRRLADVHS